MGQASDRMSGYLDPARNIQVPQNLSRDRRLSAPCDSRESFISNLLKFVRRRINNHEDCAMIVREARKHFRLQLSRKKFDELLSEVIFSLFEVVPCREQCTIREELHNFMIYKLMPLPGVAYQLPWSDLIRWLDTRSFSINFGYTTFLMLNFEAAQRIVRYGVRFEFSSLQLYPMLRRFKNEILPLFFGDDKMNLTAIHDVYTTPDSKIRLCVVLLVCYVALRMKRPNLFWKCTDSLRSLKLVLQTIRQPFVTVQEIVRFFDVSRGQNENDSRIQEISRNITEYFPKSTGFLAPRSLKHLSRCEIRKCMGKAGSLPNGVWSLRIPATLHNYLLIQRRKGDHFPKYVSALGKRRRSVP